MSVTQDEFSGLFAPEPEETSVADQGQPWKVLLVDDEPDIHAVLHLALQDMRVEGLPLELFDARSAQQAKALLAEHSDMALILLDVVMETEQAGLSLVGHIRRELSNRVVQIILVTGQPGLCTAAGSGDGLRNRRLPPQVGADLRQDIRLCLFRFAHLPRSA